MGKIGWPTCCKFVCSILFLCVQHLVSLCAASCFFVCSILFLCVQHFVSLCAASCFFVCSILFLCVQHGIAGGHNSGGGLGERARSVYGKNNILLEILLDKYK